MENSPSSASRKAEGNRRLRSGSQRRGGALVSSPRPDFE